MAEKRNPFKSPIKQSEENEEFVGAYLPLPLVNYLRLLSANYGVSVQKTIQLLLEREMEEDKTPKDVVVEELVNKATDEWYRRKDEGITESRDDYLAEIKKELTRRKILEEDQDEILKLVYSRIQWT